MLHRLAVVCALLVAIAAARLTGPPSKDAAVNAADFRAAPFDEADGTWELTFVDDFNGDSLNRSLWRVRHNESHCCPQELQLYTDDAVVVEDGDLVLRTRRLATPVSDKHGHRFNFTSGWVDTEGTWAQEEGRFAVRAKLPFYTNVSALWPAHWLMPDPQACRRKHGDRAEEMCCWPVAGEIDIMEQITPFPVVAGSYRRGKNATCCCGDDVQIPPGSLYPAWPPGGNETYFRHTYHEYAVTWSKAALVFAIDGVEYHRVDAPSSHHDAASMAGLTGGLVGVVNGNTSRGGGGNARDIVGHSYLPSTPMYWILDTAVAPWLPPAPAPVPFPDAEHRIDWVKAWRRRK